MEVGVIVQQIPEVQVAADSAADVSRICESADKRHHPL